MLGLHSCHKGGVQQNLEWKAPAELHNKVQVHSLNSGQIWRKSQNLKAVVTETECAPGHGQGDSFWSRQCLIYPCGLVFARCSTATLTGKARFIRKQMTMLKSTSPHRLPRHPHCRNPHCTNTICQHQTWGGCGKNQCLSLRQGTWARVGVSSPFVSGGSSVALIQKHLSSGQGCPKAVNDCHTFQKILISHSGVARRRNCMAINQNCLLPVN